MTNASLHLLPVHVMDLVLQHLPLAQQLVHCPHISKHCATSTATSIRYCTVLLNDDTVWHISQSPRLRTLLAIATSVILQLDTVPSRSRAQQYLLSAHNIDVLFPHLVHFSYCFTALANEDARQYDDTVETTPPLSLLPILPFLSARSATLRSLHIDQSIHRGEYYYNLDEELFPLLASYPALRRLHLAGLSLVTDHFTPLLDVPLDTLDLSTCFIGRTDKIAPPNAHLVDCALTRSCRTLKLPRQQFLTSTWLQYFDALATQRTESTRLHTMSVQDGLSIAATTELLDMPPSRALSVHLEAVDQQVFFSRAAASPHFIDMPRQLRLSVDCGMWYDQRNMRPSVDFVTAHHACIHSLSLTNLPHQPQVLSSVLATVSHCTELRSLQISSPRAGRKFAVVGHSGQVQ